VLPGRHLVTWLLALTLDVKVVHVVKEEVIVAKALDAAVAA